ncbi:tyrosine-type recombinase/integrase [Nanoarchaeota archaeon]
MQKLGGFDDNWKEKLIDDLKLKGYSRKTIRTYTYYAEKFVESGVGLEQFLLGLINFGKSRSTIRTAGFAIKFFLNREKQINFQDLPNIKINKKLPVILSKEEIDKIIKVCNNVKHRLIIMLLYSSGLRVSEVVNLKWEDVDFSRKTIHIKDAKGGKDRITLLSNKVKRELLGFSIFRKGLVFKSNRNGRYSSRAVQAVVKNVAFKAGITKNVSPHSFRHSFATHLLEDGIDIRYIKELLGHSKIETTLIYTKVSGNTIRKIKSPFDN